MSIHDLHDFLRIVVKLNTDVPKDVTKDVTKEKRLEEVLNLVLKNKFVSTKDMAKLLDVTMRTIMRDIETLRDKGKLKKMEAEKMATGKLWKDEMKKEEIRSIVPSFLSPSTQHLP